MQVVGYRSVYTRAYEVPADVLSLSEQIRASNPWEEPSVSLDAIYDVRYRDRRRVSSLKLGRGQLQTRRTGVSLEVTLSGLLHRAGHAVYLVELAADDPPSAEAMCEIQAHWIWENPDRRIFRFGENSNASVRDLFDVAWLRTMILAGEFGQLRSGDLSAHLQHVESWRSYESVFRKFNKRRRHMRPTIFGCLTELTVDSRRLIRRDVGSLPEVKALCNDAKDHRLLQKTAKLELEDAKELLAVSRNSAILLSTQEKSNFHRYAALLAQLNLVRHVQNLIGGEASKIYDTIHVTQRYDSRRTLIQRILDLEPQPVHDAIHADSGGHRWGRFGAMFESRLDRQRKLLSEVVTIKRLFTFFYDELFDANIWHSADLVQLARRIRAGDCWNLQGEIETTQRKVNQLMQLTSEINKEQTRNTRRVIKLLLFIVAIVNVLQVTPVFDDYILPYWMVWSPVFLSILLFGLLYLLRYDPD